ncbi:S8 family peptidase [Sediminivirga luteola]|uniref:S8 family peptidase n=1 Tax=Sediminivirga luteola TaxID=1774748 RepID=UPI001F59CB79|nr:S8 family peptidase [Sediminivirga luteola]
MDVDESGLRTALIASLDSTESMLASLPSVFRERVGVPLRVTLREQAMAKSNRPTKFLRDAGMPATAVGHPGELFAQARTRDLQTLRDAIASGSTKADLYAISTIDELAVFEPVAGAFGVRDLESLEAVVRYARDEHRLIRLDLFPWLSLDTAWIDEPLAAHLESIGLEIQGVRGSARRESVYVAPTYGASVAEIATLFGVRNAGTEPLYSNWREISPQSMAIVDDVSDDLREQLAASAGKAIVGVLDSGIGTPALEPYVQARETYDLGPDLNQEHGTFVAGLVLAGGALNPAEGYFGDDCAMVLDGQVLPAAPIGENELLDRIEETVRKHPEVKVWNCSFAANVQLDPLEYSVFASEMDKLSTELGILFVQAAGNYEDLPVRPWPAPAAALVDGIASPADAVNSLVVGSLTHRVGARTPVGAPASYSRRGPSFGGQTKPDVTFWSGDFGPAGEVPLAGIRSTVPGDHIAEGVGTSFATPLVSAIAANVWEELDGTSGVDSNPALVKGLLVHSASVNSLALVGADKNYYGAGVPRGGLQALFEAETSFTTVHRVPLQSKISWLRAPFPVPACLFTADGKLKAEIFMTVVFTPVLDQGYGAEAVRTCVDASFGLVHRDGNRVTITGKVPEEKTSGAHPWETQLVAAGKWSPVRTHHAKFPQGVAGSEWGLKLTLTEREDSEDGIEQTAFVFLTFRGLEEGLPVHSDGIAAVRQLSLWNTRLAQRTSVTVSTLQ